MILTGANLSATDVDNNPVGLVFTVSAVAGGQFELVADPGTFISSFTQAQVTGGAVRFVQDGSPTAPSYSVMVSDGSLSDGPMRAAVTFIVLGDTGTPATPPTPPEAPRPGPINDPVPPLATLPPSVPTPPSEPVATGEIEVGVSPSIVPQMTQEDFQIVVNAANLVNGDSFTPVPSRMFSTTTSPMSVGTALKTEAAAPAPALETNEAPSGRLASADLNSVIDVKSFVQGLNRLRDEVAEETYVEKIVVGSSFAAATGFSIGYVLWLLRGEVLLSTLLASLPAWRIIDPLPVLSFFKKEGDEEEEDDSIEATVTEVSDTPRSLPPPKPHGGSGSVKWRVVTQATDFIAENSL